MDSFRLLSSDLLNLLTQRMPAASIGCLWLCGDKVTNNRLEHGGVTVFSHHYRAGYPIKWPKLIKKLQSLEEVSIRVPSVQFDIPDLTIEDLPPTVKSIKISSYNGISCFMQVQHSQTENPQPVAHLKPLHTLFPNLTSLAFGLPGHHFPRFVDTASVIGNLPRNLTELSLGKSLHYDPKVIEFLPKTLITLQSLCLSKDIDEPVAFPPNLKSIHFNLIFSSQHLIRYLPWTLTSLQILHENESVYPTDEDWAHLPPNLKIFASSLGLMPTPEHIQKLSLRLPHLKSLFIFPSSTSQVEIYPLLPLLPASLESFLGPFNFATRLPTAETITPWVEHLPGSKIEKLPSRILDEIASIVPQYLPTNMSSFTHVQRFNSTAPWKTLLPSSITSLRIHTAYDEMEQTVWPQNLTELNFGVPISASMIPSICDLYSLSDLQIHGIHHVKDLFPLRKLKKLKCLQIGGIISNQFFDLRSFPSLTQFNCSNRESSYNPPIRSTFLWRIPQHIVHLTLTSAVAFQLPIFMRELGSSNLKTLDLFPVEPLDGEVFQYLPRTLTVLKLMESTSTKSLGAAEDSDPHVTPAPTYLYYSTKSGNRSTFENQSLADIPRSVMTLLLPQSVNLTIDCLDYIPMHVTSFSLPDRTIIQEWNKRENARNKSLAARYVDC